MVVVVGPGEGVRVVVEVEGVGLGADALPVGAGDHLDAVAAVDRLEAGAAGQPAGHEVRRRLLGRRVADDRAVGPAARLVAGHGGDEAHAAQGLGGLGTLARGRPCRCAR